MNDYQNTALHQVHQIAQTKSAEQKLYLAKICEPFHICSDQLIGQILSNSVTINFHIDRLSAGGKTVIENLIEQGIYHNQFITGTSNGALGGKRLEWEQRMFPGAYSEKEIERPKYGALNIFQFLDGACVRFGSCFFTLKPHMIKYCTFSYGDSSVNPSTLCTIDTLEGILSDLFKDVIQNSRMLNQAVSSQQEALAILMHHSNELKILGRNLDFCIEAHIHHTILLQDDVASFYVDESYRDTEFEPQVQALCQKYNIHLNWIPQRKISVHEIGNLFRGPKVPVLAKKIDILFGNKQGIINAYLIGKASRDSCIHPENWNDIGDKSEMFQLIKQLWHTVGYFG
ncbi:MAG: DUF3626 domain-containing protein [Massiliimalia sp.]|jgi:hypothetical protein